MKITDLVAGTKLQLEVFDTDGKSVKHIFASEFEWAEDEKNIYIAAPIHEGIIYPLPIDSVISMYIFSRQKDSNRIDMYTCRGAVIERVNDQKIAMLKIKILGSVESFQRRLFFRVDCSLSVKYRELKVKSKENEAEEAIMEVIPLRNAITRDISGGGIGIAVEEEIEKGMLFEFYVSLDEGKEIYFHGKTVRLDRLYGSNKYKYEAGIAFVAIDEKDREEIIRFIFFEQRKLRKKGLI